MPVRKKLAIIGAGPKAAALCARAAAIHQAIPSISIPEIKVFEKAAAGANWRGGSTGYSDGEMPLCTSLAARDLTHRAIAPLDDDDTIGRLEPSEHDAFRSAMRQFRWTGSAHPRHEELAEHIRSTIATAEGILGESVLFAHHEVVGIRRVGDTFTLSIKTPDVIEDSGFAGVVVTSPGPPRPPEAPEGAYWVSTAASAFVTNTRDYWAGTFSTPTHWQTLVFVGGGGAAAAVALDALKRFADVAPSPGVDPGVNIVFISRQPTLMSRGLGIFEESLLCDAEAWGRLTRAQREEMRSRMVSGVIFERVVRELGKYVASDGDDTRVIHESGRVSSVAYDDDTNALVVTYRGLDGALRQWHHVGLVVDARGFDGEWFLGLLDDETRRWTESVLRREQSRLGDHLDTELRVRVPGPMDVAPWLHAPMLAGFAQPPGLASLLDLGEMARRVLDGYLGRHG